MSTGVEGSTCVAWSSSYDSGSDHLFSDSVAEASTHCRSVRETGWNSPFCYIDAAATPEICEVPKCEGSHPSILKFLLIPFSKVLYNL